MNSSHWMSSIGCTTRPTIADVGSTTNSTKSIFLFRIQVYLMISLTVSCLQYPGLVALPQVNQYSLQQLRQQPDTARRELHMKAPGSGRCLAGGVAPPYCSCKCRLAVASVGWMIVALTALANPLRNALSSFHPPDTGIAADFQVVASTAIRLAQNKSFPDITAALIVVCPLLSSRPHHS